MLGQSLSNFYESVRFQNPGAAADMFPDISIVAMYGLSADKEPAKDAADRLRRAAFDLPEIHKRVLESALIELGF